MTKNKSILLITSTILAFMFALAITTVARAEDPPPPTEEPADLPAASESDWGMVNDTGTHFEITDRGYLDMTLDSSETISLTLQSFPNQISAVIRPISEAPSTQITLSGLLPSTTFYKYEDAAKEPETFTTDANGSHVYTQDLSAEHFLRIQTHKSTLFLEDDATGGDCDSIGSWDWPTKTCTLSQDVNDTIRINADGITLDGAGYTIDYYGGGVQIYYVDNVTVKNLNITDTAYGYSNTGINLYDTAGNTIEAVNVANMYYGIYLSYASYTVVADNTLSNNRYGLLGNPYTYNNTISNNNLSDNTYAGLYLYYSWSNTISGNTISDNGYDGMQMYDTSYNNISDNNISGNPNYGVYLESYQYGNNGNTFSSNTISNSYLGVYLSCYYCYNPNYYPNTSNTFSYNTISNNVYGVYEYSDYSAGYNTYHHNTIANNSDYGMFLEYVYYNTIYNNDFVDNNNQVWDGYSYYNTWNLAAPTGGNYWSHYDTPAEGCDDTNSDGFCDLELYIPNYYGYDYLPLTTPANQQQQPELSSDAADVTVNEGDSANNSGTVSDPDGDTVTLSASVGTVINNNDRTWSWSFPTNDGPGESQTVTIDADDGNGGTAQTTFGLTVNNVAPAVGLVSVPTAPIDINNQPVTGVSAPFTDPGTADTHTCTADYGDGSGPQAGTVAAGVCSGPDQTYTEAGVYEVTVEVTDDDSGVGNATATSFIVIYDPSGGFVTGGGWIDSPSGAYTPDNPNDPDFSGKANFGFVAKYKKGADVPDGNTQFQFKAGDLNFHSSSYQWLVVAGARAQFKGEGTINGAGNYGFMLTAIDGQINGGGGADKFRIKIWDMDNGDAPIYDNLVGGGADDADPTTTLGGGRIVIHNK